MSCSGRDDGLFGSRFGSSDGHCKIAIGLDLARSEGLEPPTFRSVESFTHIRYQPI
jgi:hypothetical protein